MLTGISSCSLFEEQDKPSENNVIEAVGIVIDDKTVHLNGFETYQVEYTISPLNTTQTEVTYELSNDRVCTIDSNGLITANNVNGSVDLTIRVKDNPIVSNTVKIVVTKIDLVEDIIPSLDSFDFYFANQEILFTYDVLPKYATNIDLNIYVEDTNVAYLNDKKTALIAKNPGRTNLVFETLDEYSDITVKVPVIFDTSMVENLVPEEANDPTKLLTYKELKDTGDVDVLPSTATKDNPNKVMVIPVEFSDYTFDSVYGVDNGEERIKEDLDIAFNGTNEETNYWESVSSYFEKSSYGKEYLDFDIMDVYKSEVSSTDISKNQNLGLMQIANLILNALNYTETNAQNITLSDYDIDKDGKYDSIWFVYSCPNYSNMPRLDQNENFWAFVTSVEETKEGTPENPALNQFGWASYDFMYGQGMDKIDTHTYIHETGHLFGLNDYYNYTNENSPLGAYDMQDNNVGDHNAWTKAALGWVNPIIYDSSKNKIAKVHLDPNDQAGSAFFITNNYENSVFDEYLVLELYSPKGLNELDAETAYSAIGRMPNSYGVKMYHVDSRLITGTTTYGQNYYDLSLLKNGKPNIQLEIGASNTNDYSRNYTIELFNQITLISSNPTYAPYLERFYPYSANDFFQTGDVFDMETYKYYTYRDSGLLNDGTALNVKITFENVSREGADILIETI